MEENKNNQINLLFTGGLGYIASHTITEVYEFNKKNGTNYKVTILDNLENSSLNILERLREITGQEIIFYNCDILKVDELEKVFQENNFKYLLHFAAKKSVAESQKNPLSYYKTNVSGSINVIEACLKYKVNNFIFSSSCCVYGNCDNIPTETENLNPINTYGRTKMFMERILIDTSLAEKDFNTLILRYANPVSAHKSGLIGENPKGTPANLFPVIENHLRGKTEKIKIFGKDYNTEDGTAIRDYVHVSDIAFGHVLAIGAFEKMKIEGKNTEIFNMGTDNGYSVYDVISTYIESTGAKIDYEYSGRRDGDAEKAVPNSEKIKGELNWRPQTSLTDMCKDSYNFIKKNPSFI
jgi:UDP-glucose 4-epimerase